MILYRWYRAAILFLIFFHAIWIFFPWHDTYDEGTLRAMEWLEYGSVFSEVQVIFIGLLLSLLYFFAYIGMFFYKNWARNLLLIMSVVGGLIIPLYGLKIESRYEAMLGFYLTLVEGGVLALAYFTAINNRFFKVNNVVDNESK